MSSRSQQGLPELGSAKHGLGYELNGEILGEDALAQDVLVLDEDAPSPLGGDLRLHPDEYVHSPGSSGRIATSGHGEGWTRPETSASRHNFISLDRFRHPPCAVSVRPYFLSAARTCLMCRVAPPPSFAAFLLQGSKHTTRRAGHREAGTAQLTRDLKPISAHRHSSSRRGCMVYRRGC